MNILISRNGRVKGTKYTDWYNNYSGPKNNLIDGDGANGQPMAE